MNPKPLSKTIVLNDGREIIIETGKLASFPVSMIISRPSFKTIVFDKGFGFII